MIFFRWRWIRVLIRVNLSWVEALQLEGRFEGSILNVRVNSGQISLIVRVNSGRIRWQFLLGNHFELRKAKIQWNWRLYLDWRRNESDWLVSKIWISSSSKATSFISSSSTCSLFSFWRFSCWLALESCSPHAQDFTTRWRPTNIPGIQPYYS